MVPKKNTLHLHCTHTYCRTCLLDLFTSSISTPTLFPPRCCKQTIPLETCRVMLPKELVKDFDLKVDELATPNPTYCANADCSKFIRPKDITGDIATCVFCKGKTCAQCKNKGHDGLCPSDPHVQLLMDAAKRSKWQQCTKCSNMVELAQGCFHMTCRCTHQFCYLCGVKWKRCSCPQWDEGYLTHEPPLGLPGPAAAAGHDLHEHHWRRRNGGVCGGCGATYLPWVLRCTGCNMLRCLQCVDNDI
ncbi:hypothetical protein C7974DRAFT_309160 [Boeremia exigua]|uniref:uncharacterized protein n=1 Tax=Boeremia exigua TaxID=749465 RepID=UPI001E8CD5F3|nr:uncharacterized protein C7974DRAFT_309160 [Boeremia exigua]KAH6633709.1 hypothetical protein C7974DRAFT_309160 [Boeremia exigua]